MGCTRPLKGYRASGGGVVFSTKDGGFTDRHVELPCGQCIGCRLERSRQWAVRCMHEAQTHEANAFVTLTYDPEHLPSNGSLVVEDWQKFAKRLRKQVGPFRFLHCGEYGERLGRPHYHACLFGLDFAEDRQEYKKSLFISDSLNRIWGKGDTVIGNLTFESAAYVARYVVKKITGKTAEQHYQRLDQVTGELYQLKPEYSTMSRRPGIGYEWYQKFKQEVYPMDEVVARGRLCKPPRYYDKILEQEDPQTYERVRRERKAKALAHQSDNTWQRLRVKEEVTEARLALGTRSLDESLQ